MGTEGIPLLAGKDMWQEDILASASSRGAAEDQATLLRSMVSAQAGGNTVVRNRGLRTITVVSGKGGVGKTNLSVNLALAMGSQGFRVAVLDADLGLANVDILFGMMPKYNLGHVIHGHRQLEEILVSVEENVLVIPGGAGVQELADLDQIQQAELIEKLAVLEGKVDVLLVDTGAGIHRNIISFALAADTTVLLTSPEPTSIRDAYGVLKSLTVGAGGDVDVRLLVNMAMSDDEAEAVAERIQMAANQFLGLSVPYIGQIPWDRKVRDAVQERRPFFTSFPGCRASQALLGVAGRLSGPDNAVDDGWGRGLKSFLFRLTRRLGLGK